MIPQRKRGANHCGPPLCKRIDLICVLYPYTYKYNAIPTERSGKSHSKQNKLRSNRAGRKANKRTPPVPML